MEAFSFVLIIKVLKTWLSRSGTHFNLLVNLSIA